MISEKKCYATYYTKRRYNREYNVVGPMIWLTDQQLLLEKIKGGIRFSEVVADDFKEKYKIFMDVTVEDIDIDRGRNQNW